MKKNIFIIFLILAQFAATLQAQITGGPGKPPCSEDGVILNPGNVRNLAIGSTVQQSSNVTDGGFASLAVDGNIGTLASQTTRTSLENQPWWEADLGQKSVLSEVKVWYNASLYPSGLQGSYLLFSELPFGNSSLNEALASPVVKHVYVGTALASGTSISVNPTRARYVRIQKGGLASIGLTEVFLIGEPGGPGVVEDCDNGIDDDGDCKIDCADSDCKPLIWMVKKTEPTCASCNDGSIYIKAYGSNLEFSINGGQTYTSCAPTGVNGYCTFEGLDEGNYNIKVRNSTCESAWPNPVRLTAPLGNPNLSHCANGDFEAGSEQNWTGTTGTNPNGSYNITATGITNFATNPQLQILSGATDPLTNLPITAATGTYFVQIGDNAVGGNAASARYCLTVNQSNGSNLFWYYLVFEDGGHPANQNPFFQWRILSSNGTVLQSSPPIIADLNNPFFSTVPNTDIVYRPWTCQTLDLSAWLGQSICVEFVAADCQQQGHMGYAYIDGLCTDPIPPTATLVDPPHVFCAGQPANIQVENEHLLNQYQWCIARVNNAGSTFDVATLPQAIGSTVPDLVDVVAKYKQVYPNYVFNCTDKFRITLKMFSDCSQGETKMDIWFSCNGYGIDYPDILVCDGNQDVQITGTNNCQGCTYEWSIANDPYNTGLPASSLLSNIHSATPTILGTLNLYAFSMVYKVTVTTPEGCVYTDEVATINVGQITAEFGTAPTGTCTFDEVSCLKFNRPLEFDKYFNLKYFIQGNYGQYPDGTPFQNIAEEEIPLTIISSPNTPAVKYCFKPSLRTLLRGFDQKLKVLVTIKPNIPGVRVINVNCTRIFDYFRASDSQLFGDINIFVPNVFDPTSPNPENAVIHPYFSNNVYEAWFKVFDRWGEKVHEAHVKSQTGQPLTEPQLHGMAWNGVFNGQVMDPAVYTFVVDFQNCQVAPADCFDATQSDIIAPHIRTDENSFLPFGALARGVSVNPNTSGGNTPINCGYFSPPSNKIVNYNDCTNALQCNDAAHAGDVTLID